MHRTNLVAVPVDGDEEITAFELVKQAIQHYELEDIENDCGVAVSTMRRWVKGITRKPRLDTVSKVCACIGHPLLPEGLTGETRKYQQQGHRSSPVAHQQH